MSTSARRTIPTSRTSTGPATPTTPTTSNTACATIGAAAGSRRARPRPEGRRGGGPPKGGGGAVARKVVPGLTVRGALVQIGPHRIDRGRWDWAEVERNPFFSPDAT